MTAYSAVKQCLILLQKLSTRSFVSLQGISGRGGGGWEEHACFD